MLTLHAIFYGQVQGVGFRWTVVEHAECFLLTGTVQNLPSHGVEVYAQGAKSSLEAFLKAVQDDPGNARIIRVETSYLDAPQSYMGFRIIR